MGFLNGRITYVRFRVSGDSPLPFGDELLEQVQLHALGRPGGDDRPIDGLTIGWAGGPCARPDLRPGRRTSSTTLSTSSIRIDTNKIPGTLLKAYTKIETDARAQLNPSGYPTKAQRPGGQGGRHHPGRGRGGRRPVPADVPLPGALGRSVQRPLRRDNQPDRHRTAENPCSARRSTARRADHGGKPGLLASRGAWPRAFGRGLRAGRVHRGGGYSTVAWADSDASSRDFWGNEFLIWLWHTLQIDGDTIKLPDDSEVTDHGGQDPDPGLPARREWPRRPDQRRADQDCPRRSGRSRRASCRAGGPDPGAATGSSTS